MFQLVALHALIFMTVVTSVMGATCLLRDTHIFDLKLTTRNFMAIGACCAMSAGFLGANFCAGLQMPTLWNYAAATLLFAIGLFATAHIVVDFSDRLRILKRSNPSKAVVSSLPPKSKAKVYDLCAYRLNLEKGC